MKIRFIKDCNMGEVGQIIDTDMQGVADLLIERGVAESIGPEDGDDEDNDDDPENPVVKHKYPNKMMKPSKVKTKA